MNRSVGLLTILMALAVLTPALVVLAGQRPPDDELVLAATAVVVPTEDHDLAVASFEKLFTGSVISGDTVAFSFEIVNQGLQQDTARWQLVSNNATAETADDITIASGDALLASGFSLRTGPGGISWNTSGAKTGDHTVTLSVGPVAGETTSGNNSKTVTVAVIERPTHDVAVTDIVPISGDGVTPLGTADFVLSGTIVNVEVSARNRGTVRETFGLALTDDTDSLTIASFDVTLDPGEGVTFGLPWETTVASTGDHTLTATATLTGDADTANNAASTTVRVRFIVTQIAIEGADALFPADPIESPIILQDPAITTLEVPVSAMFIGNDDASNEVRLTPVVISTVKGPVTSFFLKNQDATANLTLEPVLIDTLALPNTALFLRAADGISTITLSSVNVPTEKVAVSEAFIRNADAIFDPDIVRDPFASRATIRSASVHLQGRADSNGAFLLVDGQRHFVKPDGSFNFEVDPGTHNIQIMAPGYLTVDVVSPTGSDLVLNAGDVLTIPELTMVYGDANGDGAIDVKDLALGGRNFGETPGEVELTPQ